MDAFKEGFHKMLGRLAAIGLILFLMLVSLILCGAIATIMELAGLI